MGNRIAYHTDGRWIAVASIVSGVVRSWVVRSGDSYHRVPIAGEEIPASTNALCSSPDGHSLRS